ncbi:MAG: hypothetical protein HY292_02155 [Planctomycetes bacterium]|nr:hypothetical protein [Planctomycetota bacterium]
MRNAKVDGARCLPKAFAMCAAVVAGIAVVALAPPSTFAAFRESVIGMGGDAAVTITAAQRFIAACGVLLAAIAMSRLLRARAVTLALPRRRWLIIAAIPFAVAATINYVPSLRETLLDSSIGAYEVASIAFGLVALLALGPILVREITRQPLAPLVDGIAAGAAYGCVSALWHCCPPLWFDGPLVAVALVGGLVIGSIVLAGFVSAAGSSIAMPWGLALAGVMLAGFYPWHTPLWSVQCVAAGAFFAWLARRTGRLLAPGLALATAFLVHMSLPFIGWAGPVVSIALLVACCLMRKNV